MSTLFGSKKNSKKDFCNLEERKNNVLRQPPIVALCPPVGGAYVAFTEAEGAAGLSCVDSVNLGKLS
jgi:hypothetical protein